MQQHITAAMPPNTKDVDGTTYWVDPKGGLIPAAMVKPIDQERDLLVREIVAEALAVERAAKDFRVRRFADIEAFTELSAERYGVTPRGLRDGGKGNLTLYSFDGRYKVQRKNADLIRFGEELQAAKVLIDQCIHDWAAGSSAELQALVDHAFQVDRTGRINTGRVLGLRRLDITDERWLRAMQAIADATVQVGTATYLLVYERIGMGDEWRLVSTDSQAGRVGG